MLCSILATTIAIAFILLGSLAILLACRAAPARAGKHLSDVRAGAKERLDRTSREYLGGVTRIVARRK